VNDSIDLAPRHFLRVIGEFALSVDAAPVDLRNRKAQAIVAQLALCTPPVQSRERLADSLWSARGSEQARQSLRQTLHDLRRALGEAGGCLVEVRRNEVSLAPGMLRVDLLDLIGAVENCAPPPQGVDWSALRDAILPGLDDVDPVFGDWLVARRATLLERLTVALERRMAAAGSDSDAREWALILAALEPSHEPACRRLMESDAARGDVRAALRRYGALWDLLDADFAAEPSPETQALAVRLKSLEPVSPVTTAATLVRPGITLSIGAFRLDGVPTDVGYLVRGFRQDLIASLTPYRDWVLIEPEPGSDAPRENGVYEVDGTAYPSRDGVRINVTLKESAARRFIWGQQEIDLSLGNWFETCRLTTRRIAAALDVRVSGDRLAHPAEEPGIAAPLYDRLLLARDLLTRWTTEDDRRAETIFRSILREAPNLARAQLGIAQLLNTKHIVNPGVARNAEASHEAWGLARQAVEADPLDAGSQLCLGWSCAMCGRYDEAVAALTTAAELNPTHPRTLSAAADALALCGAGDAALALVEASQTLDLGASRLHWAHRGSALYHTGHFAEAAAALERAGDATPISGGLRVAALVGMGDTAAASAAWARYSGWIAGRWHASGAATPEAIAGWFLDAQPMADPAARAALRRALALAGAPVLTDA